MPRSHPKARFTTFVISILYSTGDVCWRRMFSSRSIVWSLSFGLLLSPAFTSTLQNPDTRLQATGTKDTREQPVSMLSLWLTVSIQCTSLIPLKTIDYQVGQYLFLAQVQKAAIQKSVSWCLHHSSMRTIPQFFTSCPKRFIKTPQ